MERFLGVNGALNVVLTAPKKTSTSTSTKKLNNNVGKKRFLAF